MTRAIAYYRVSTEGQADRGNGIDAQKLMTQEFANKMGYQIVQEAFDLGISGTAPLHKRPGLLGALEGLERGMVLVVAKLDRLSRDLLFQLVLEKELKKKGCRIISASGEGTESDEPADQLMRQMLQAFSQFERNLIAARTRSALAARKKLGKRTGTIPFGQMVDGDGFLIDCPKDQKTLAMVRNYRSLNWSWDKITFELNAKGIYNRKGQPWNKPNLWKCCASKV